jgi:hypothetical protein
VNIWNWIKQNVPAKVVVPIIGIAVTAWLIPALTRQWQDQQRARELKAGMVKRIGRDTTEALVLSSFIANGRFERVRQPGRPFQVPMQLFNDMDLKWVRTNQEIEAELQAYFPGTSIVRDWRKYGRLVRDTYWLITERTYNRPGTIKRLQRLFPRLRCHVESLRAPFVSLRGKLANVNHWKRCKEEQRTDVRTKRGNLGKSQKVSPRANYFFIATALLDAKSDVTDDILHADPEGLSTDASDFFHDLVPFI